MRAETAVKRNELRELYEKFQADMDALLEKRQAIRERVLRIWKAHFDGEVTLDLSSAMVSRRNKPELKVRDTIALLNALDAAVLVVMGEFLQNGCANHLEAPLKLP
jgi:hypothetical protein